MSLKFFWGVKNWSLNTSDICVYVESSGFGGICGVGDRSGVHSFVCMSLLGILVIRVTHLNYPVLGGWGREGMVMVRPCSDWNWKLYEATKNGSRDHSQDLHGFSFSHGICFFQQVFPLLIS